MAKDPAFLFYANDFEVKTKFFSHEQVGKYMRLLITQFQFGRLSKAQIEHIAGWDELIMEKFTVDEKGLYFNERLEAEKSKRVAYSESRRKNVHSRYTSSTHEQSMNAHMENENVNEDININKKEREAFDQLRHFDLFFKEYPKPIERSKALGAYCVLVQGEKTHERIMKSLVNYRAHLEHENKESVWKKPKNPDKWLEGWMDWENYVAPVKETPEFQAKMAKLGVKQ